MKMLRQRDWPKTHQRVLAEAHGLGIARRGDWADEVHFFIDESGGANDSEMILVAVGGRYVSALRDIITRARREYPTFFQSRNDFHAHEAGEWPGLVHFVLSNFVSMAKADSAELVLVRVRNGALSKRDRGYRAYCRALKKLICNAPVHGASVVSVHIATLYNGDQQIATVRAAVEDALHTRQLPTVHPRTGEPLVFVRPAALDQGLQVADALAFAAYGRFATTERTRKARGRGSKARGFGHHIDRLYELGRVQDGDIPPPSTGAARWSPSPRVALEVIAPKKSNDKSNDAEGGNAAATRI